MVRSSLDWWTGMIHNSKARIQIMTNYVASMPNSSCYALWQRHVQVADEQNPLRTELGVVCKHCSHTLLVPPLDAQLMPTGLDFARTQAVKHGMRCDIYCHILDNHEVLTHSHTITQLHYVFFCY